MEFIKKILFGFATGLGFALALVIVAYLLIEPVMESMYDEVLENTTENMDWSYDPSTEKLVLSNEVSRVDERGIVLTGMITNEDEKAWSSIKIELELFYTEGNFVHECSTYISSKLEPGKSENFKISCRDCKREQIPDFETYKVRVVDANSF